MYLREFKSPNVSFKVFIEDDDRTAYAYLLKDGKIVGDVWLYNVMPATDLPGWETGDEMPFINPASLAKPFAPPLSEDEVVRVFWTIEGHSGDTMAEVHIREQLHAVLKEGAKPGWCRLAKADGPLAFQMKNEPTRP